MKRRLTLFITLFCMAAQMAPSVQAADPFSTVYSLYKLNKLKNNLLNAVECVYKPWKCKAGRIGMMAAAFALIVYIMQTQGGEKVTRGLFPRGKEEFPETPEPDLTSTTTASTATEVAAIDNFIATLEEGIKATGVLSAADVRSIATGIKDDPLSRYYSEAAGQYFIDNPHTLQDESAAQAAYTFFIEKYYPNISLQQFKISVVPGLGRYSGFVE